MAVVVVSDTSPVRALAHLGLVDLLEALYGSVLVPPAVADELLRPRGPGPVVNLNGVAFIHVRPAADAAAVARLRATLDPGESEAIVLAIEAGADLFLVDDARAKDAAARLGLNVTGVFGILLDAKRQGRVAAVAPLMDRLRTELNFFMSDGLRALVLRLAGE